jgi:hypothetical protein
MVHSVNEVLHLKLGLLVFQNLYIYCTTGKHSEFFILLLLEQNLAEVTLGQNDL